MKQQTLAMAADQGEGFEVHRRATRRDVFLSTMEPLVPWSALCAVIEPHYPKAGKGRPPVGLERMLRMYFVQHWFNLADEACEEALLDSTALRRFVGIDLGRERVPDGTTLLKFRRLLEQHDLGASLFAQVNQTLRDRGLKVGTGTIVDATIIGAPSSTKNARKARDPDMHQTRKGQQWYFGMKLHIGVDSRTGLVHSAAVTAANVHDKHLLADLLHGEERRVYGDSAYASQKALIRGPAPQAKDFTNQRIRKGGEVDEAERSRNRNKSRIRARVEHVFAVVKRLWGFSKVRYRGLDKNANRSFVALGLANLYLSRPRVPA
ncbi:IS5 family transposase [Acidihalobacter yilgarnensis]|uniref:IS5 family transposase n=1 Tax=Acidihalobacter yilgarnensis TaxID=2819280 RepID=A0A1D8IQR6_9GAMM|nr:IS5 family transposase [Acidihalobacter yilgarnensis]AOU98745.1 IS5 family transposase [Acidihalobacter yilgarnensis]